MSAPPGQPAKKKSPALLWIAILGGGCLMVVVCGGILAAIAIPSFVKYVRESKATEARANLSSLAVAVEDRCSIDGRLPATAGPVPPAPGGEEKVVGDFQSDPVFRDLGFDPMVPVYYSYGIRPGVGEVTLYARGDLDGDGVTGEQTWTCTAADCTCREDFVDDETRLE